MYPLKKRSVDIVELARQVVSEFLNELPEQYHIEFREDSQSCTITLNGDHSLLHRMLYNLISNCIIHNPNGCNITLSIFLMLIAAFLIFVMMDAASVLHV